MSEARILTDEELRQIGALQVTPGSWHVVFTDDDRHMNAVYVGTVDRGPDHDGAYDALPDRAGEVVAITLLQSPAVASHDSEAWDDNARLIAAAPDLRRTALHLLRDRDGWWDDARRLEAERDTLRARVTELEAPGECQSIHKLRAEVARLRAILVAEGAMLPDARETG